MTDTSEDCAPGHPLVVGLLAAAGGVLAAAARVHPTANAAGDVLVTLCFGVVVVAAAARAEPRAWLTSCAIAAVAAAGWWIALPAAAATLALVGRTPSLGTRHRPLLGGLVGIALLHTLLHLPAASFGSNLALSVLSIACLVVSAADRTPMPANGRRVLRAIGVVGAAAVAGFLGAILLARHDVERGLSRAQDGLAAARRGDGERAAQQFDAASDAFRSAQGDLAGWWAQPARLLPVVGQHARSLEILSGAGADLAEAAETAARDANLEDLRVRDGRLDLDQVRSMARPLEQVSAALRRADSAAPRAASPWLVAPVADRVAEFRRSVDEAVREAATASEAVAVLPDLLGGSGRRVYFVAFGTEAETLELGGFMGAYAVLTANNGRLRLGGADRVRSLNERFAGRQFADPSVLPEHYRAMLPHRFWQNIPASPDFPTVAEAVHQLWPARALGPIDGVVYMDTSTLAALLDLTGPIRLSGRAEPLTADTAVDFLLRGQYVEFPNDDRHDFLVDTASTVFEELTTGDLPGPGRLADTVAPAVAGRRLLFNSFRPAEQTLFERLRVDGALPPVREDFLSVRAINRGLNKVDAMMHRTLDYDVVIDPGQQRVEATLTVTVRNDVDPSDLPANAVDNRVGEPPGTNTTTVVVYSPLDLVDLTRDGEPIGRGASPVYDRNRYTALIDVPPGDEVTVVFHLEGTIDLRGGYRLDLVPQPLANPDAVTVRVSAVRPWRTWASGELSTELREVEEVWVPFDFAL